MNATKTARNRIKLLGITEDDFRSALRLGPSHRIGAKDVDAYETRKVDALTTPNAAWDQINFPVELKEMQFRGKESLLPVPRRRALVRTDTDEVLNVVSDRYKLVPHADILLPVAQALQEMGVAIMKEGADVSQRGAYIRYTWILEEEPAEISKDDIVHWAVTLRNSYNYEAPLEFSFGAFRLICANGLMVPAEAGLSMSGGKHRQGLDVDHALFEVRQFLAERANIAERWQRWHSTELDPKEFSRVLDTTADFSKKAREEIYLKLVTEKRKTLWTVYNAMTWYITHRITTKADRDALVRHTLHSRALHVMDRLVRHAA